MDKLKNLTLSNILSYLALVEQYIERRPVFDNYLPNEDFDHNDIISLQKEASSMLKFVGLNNYIALISYEKTQKGIAGTINLNHDKEVFIEIDKEMLNRPKSQDAILGVLAHEICHKLLFTHGLYMSDTTSNEICTDLATIYVGFGILTIHGCSSVKSWDTEQRNYDGGKTIITNTQTFSTGYLTPKSYILAYIMMARSYGIKNEDLGLGYVLDNDVLKNAYVSALSESIPFIEYTNDQIKENFIQNSKDIAHLNKDIILLRSMLKDFENNLASYYKQLDYINQRLIFSEAEKHPLASFYSIKFDNIDISRTSLREIFDNFLNDLFPFTHSSIDNLNSDIRYVTCPICGLKSSKPLDNNSISIRKCKCGRIFVWDAEHYRYEQNNQSSKLKEQNNNSFIDKIKKLFK